MKVFAVFDKVSNTYDWLSYEVNEQMFIRKNLKFICSQRPLRDLELYRIGSFDEITGEIIPCDKVLIDWNSYKYPETKAEQLSPLQFEELKQSVDKKGGTK